MKELFVSDKCPDCHDILDDYKLNPEKYKDIEIINITDSMYNLKRFLIYRDKYKDFEPIKENLKIGIPLLVDEDKTFKFL